jgi:hypothetical protein
MAQQQKQIKIAEERANIPVASRVGCRGGDAMIEAKRRRAREKGQEPAFDGIVKVQKGTSRRCLGWEKRACLIVNNGNLERG